jgi:hypothetical protein
MDKKTWTSLPYFYMKIHHDPGSEATWLASEHSPPRPKVQRWQLPPFVTRSDRVIAREMESSLKGHVTVRGELPLVSMVKRDYRPFPSTERDPPSGNHLRSAHLGTARNQLHNLDSIFFFF